MKIFTSLIYATLLLYANQSFTHERKDLKTLRDNLTGSLQHIKLNSEPVKVKEIKILNINNVSETIDFSDSKVRLINFWATWCVPCRDEMPSFNNLFKSINSDKFSIMVIAAGRNSDTAIKTFFSQYNLTNLESYKDPKGKVSSSMNIVGLPTTLIVDQHSNELGRLIGGTDWNSQEAINFIKEIIDH